MSEEELRNKEYFSSVLKGLEDLRVRNKEDIRQSQVEALVGGNKTTANLNKYLFTVSTFLIPIIFSLISLEEVRSKLDKQSGTLISLSIIFLVASILSGFTHIIYEIIFYRKWFKNADRRIQIWASNSFWPNVPTKEIVERDIEKYESFITRTDDIQHDLKEESPNIFLIEQFTFWFIGIIFLVIIIFRLLP